MEQLSHDNHETSITQRSIRIFAEQLTSPYNVGSLFRLADALGISKVYFGGETPLPPNRKINKTSRSTDRIIPFEHVQDASLLFTELKEQNYQLIALELCDESIPLNDIKLKKNRPICLILGDEKTGVSQLSLDAANQVVHIPMHGKNSSMNVIQACAIAAYTILNQQL